MNESKPGRRAIALAIAVALCGIADSPTAFADTLPGALAQAYVNNPTINAQRAALRATDEGVPIALSGYRPTVKGTIVAGSNDQFQTLKTPPVGAPGTTNGQPLYPGRWDIFANQSYGVAATQTLYNGFQTANRTRQAESQVSAGRETLRLTELNLLLQAATAYMNLLRDTALLDLNRSNVVVLQEQLRQSRDRFNVGEVTKTDVAQAESRLAAGRSQLAAAESQYITSKAVYRQVIGIEPGKLAPGAPVDSKSPSNLGGAIARARQENPNVTAAALGVDVAALQVKINEGALYPNRCCDALRHTGLPTTPDPAAAAVAADASLRHGHDPVLSGRRRICDDPPVQGDVGAEPHQPGYPARHGATANHAGLGPARRRQGADSGDPSPGARRRNRAQRRARRSPRRAAHHARRS